MSSKFPEQETFASNKAWWDERAPDHAASEFYDLQQVIDGGDRLTQREIDEVGSVDGCKMIHLQCHLGTETIGWARRGAAMSGLDFSDTTLRHAKLLADACNISVDYRLGNVYDAPEIFSGESFDKVYVNIGSLHYLPDITRWAKVVKQLLREQGVLYLNDIHPVSTALAETTPAFDRDYFNTAGELYDEPGSYAGTTEDTANNEHVVWDHTIGDVVTALAESGMRINFLHEWHGAEYRQFPYQIQNTDGIWINPSHMGVFPSMYSIMATKG